MAISWHLKQFGANRIVNINLTNSNWKPHLTLLKVFDVSSEMSDDPKNYFGFVNEFTELVYSITTLRIQSLESVIVHGRSRSQNRLNARQSWNIHRSSIKPIESIRYFFRKAILKIILVSYSTNLPNFTAGHLVYLRPWPAVWYHRYWAMRMLYTSSVNSSYVKPK